MSILVGFSLVVVMHVPNSPYLASLRPPVNYETLEECIEQAKIIMSDFDTRELALCSPAYRNLPLPDGDPT